MKEVTRYLAEDVGGVERLFSTPQAAEECEREYRLSGMLKCPVWLVNNHWESLEPVVADWESERVKDEG